MRATPGSSIVPPWGTRAPWALIAAVLCVGCLSLGPSLRAPQAIGVDSAGQGTPPGAAGQSARGLRVHELQLRGTHNSYHQRPGFSLRASWKYSHRSLRDQLSHQGVRQLELDLHAPSRNFKVYHLPVVDPRTSCNTFRHCLRILGRWSREHPDHMPVFVFLEAKQPTRAASRVRFRLPAIRPPEFGVMAGGYDAIDRIIRSEFSGSSLFAPDELRGDFDHLRDAVLQRGWPLVSKMQGRVVFVLLDRKGRERRAYLRGHPGLRGRAMFLTVPSHRPEAAVLNMPDAIRSFERIQMAARLGFLVRTRADLELRNDRRRREAALASGAHFLSGDLLGAWTTWGASQVARCNPVTATETCGYVPGMPGLPIARGDSLRNPRPTWEQ